MAITRQTTQPLASADINDQYGVDVTIHQGRERLTVKLTRGEALELAREIQAASFAAGFAAIEDGVS